MKILTQHLLALISSVIPVVPSKNLNRLTACVLLDIDTNSLTASTTDLEVFFTATHIQEAALIEGRERPKKLCINANNFHAAVSNLPAGDEDFTTIEVEEKRIVMKAGKRRYAFPLEKHKDFPAPEEFKTRPKTHKWGPEVFAAISKAVHFSDDGKNKPKPHMAGVCVHNNIVVATDSFRLYKCEFPEELLPRSLTLPRKLCSLLPKNNKEATIVTNYKTISIEYPGLKISSYLITEDFPKYDAIIPTDETAKDFFESDKETLKLAIEAMELTSEIELKRIILTAKEQSLKLTSKDDTRSVDGEDDIEITSSTEMQKAFNYTFLLHALKVCEQDKVRFKFGTEAKGLKINDGSQTIMVMPMKLTN